MDILIRPILASLVDDDDCHDADDEDALAFEQGVDSETVEVQPGETFDVPPGHEGIVGGHVILDGGPDFTETLSSGTYRLSEHGTRLQSLCRRH